MGINWYSYNRGNDFNEYSTMSLQARHNKVIAQCEAVIDKMIKVRPGTKKHAQLCLKEKRLHKIDIAMGESLGVYVRTALIWGGKFYRKNGMNVKNLAKYVGCSDGQIYILEKRKMLKPIIKRYKESVDKTQKVVYTWSTK